MAFVKLEPSIAYANWLETRIAHYVNERKRQDAVEIAAERLKLEQHPEQGCELLTRIAKRKEATDEMATLLKHHVQCLGSAKLGSFCDEDALDEAGVRVRTWFPGRNYITHKKCRTDSPAPSAQSMFSAVSHFVRMEEFSNEGGDYEGGDLADDRILVRSFSVKLEKKWPGFLHGTTPLRQSLAQDQLCAWLVGVQAQARSRSRPPIGQATRSRSGAPGGRIYLPTELFRHVASFLEPFRSVIMSPAYYVAAALSRRFRDLATTLEAAYRVYLDRLADGRRAVSGSAANKVRGKVWWERETKTTKEQKNKARVRLLVKFDGVEFSTLGAQHWPTPSELEITSSLEWRDIYDSEQEMAKQQKMRSNFCFRLDSAAAQRDNVLLAVQDFFERKGFAFSYEKKIKKRNRRGRRFLVSWGKDQDEEESSSSSSSDDDDESVVMSENDDNDENDA
ncbi:unnamed protein product [Amoebophrya sp. A120]|nr:unnamed protein product [Amoebophrya sp. A120]|eukprot:GSA120T00003150001.1